MIAIPPYSALAAFVGGAALCIFNGIPWHAFFLLTRAIGIRLYVLRDKEVCRLLQKRLGVTSHVADGGKGYGISVGRWYYASVSIHRGDHGDDYDVWMIATEASFAALVGPEGEDKEKDKGSDAGAEVLTTKTAKAAKAAKEGITIFERTGSNYNVWFRQRKITVDTVKPRPDQEVVLVAIEEHHRRVGHTVVFLHGAAGSGKTMIGVLATARLGGTYCDTLLPWQPGDSLADLYAEADPTAERPLILAFDEVDGVLCAVQVGIAPHKAVPILIRDKAGWNRFFDKIDLGMYPHLILLLTSNRDPDFIHALDPSYIRKGRVNLTFEIGKVEASVPEKEA